MNSPATTEQLAEGPVVAVQYPEKVDFTGVLDAAQMATDYGPLVSIDADSASQYNKLTEAIKVVSKARLHIDKEESRFKDPANAFAKLVREHAKKERLPFETLEGNLKKEKKRVDDIQAERLEEQKKLWAENLQTIRSRGQNLFGMTMEQLRNELATIDAVNLDDLDFGDYIEDAKAELANARIRTEQTIEQEKQKLAVEAERQRLADAEELRKKNELKLEIERCEEAAYVDDEMRTMKAKMAEMEASEAAKNPLETEPEPEAPFVKAGPSMDEVSDSDFADSIGMGGQSNIARPGERIPEVTFIKRGSRGSAKIPAEVKAAAHSFDDDIEEDEAVISEDDCVKMLTFIGEINNLIDNAPVDFENQDCVKAVNRVLDSVRKAPGYLKGVIS